MKSLMSPPAQSDWPFLVSMTTLTSGFFEVL